MARRILRIFVLTSLLLMLGAGVGLVVFQARGGKFLAVQTGSMEPQIHQGGVVAVTRVEPETLVAGDIITFTNPANKSQTITHRVVGMREDPMLKGQKQFVTKGDANAVADQPVPYASVVGKVRTQAPYVGYGLTFVRRPLGLALLIYVPALIVIGNELRKLIRYYKSQEPYVLPEVLARRKQETHHPARVLLFVGIISLVTLGGAVGVHAALQTTVSLGGNTITSAAPPSAQGSVTLRRVFVACDPADTTTPDHLDVTFDNRTLQTADISGWYLLSGTTKVFTFPGGSSIPKRSVHHIETPIGPGQDYDQGSLELRTATNQLVDSMAWDRVPTDRACRVSH